MIAAVYALVAFVTAVVVALIVEHPRDDAKARLANALIGILAALFWPLVWLVGAVYLTVAAIRRRLP